VLQLPRAAAGQRLHVQPAARVGCDEAAWRRARTADKAVRTAVCEAHHHRAPRLQRRAVGVGHHLVPAQLRHADLRSAGRPADRRCQLPPDVPVPSRATRTRRRGT
jgi:hypothetical protein